MLFFVFSLGWLYLVVPLVYVPCTLCFLYFGHMYIHLILPIKKVHWRGCLSCTLQQAHPSLQYKRFYFKTTSASVGLNWMVAWLEVGQFSPRYVMLS